MSVFGVWMWPDSLRSQPAERAADRCASLGVTDIFFLTKGLAGTVPFPGGPAPAASERDLLRELLDSAHRRGIRVHAWLTSANDEHYKTLHPESGRCHFTRGKDKGYISLTDEGYLEYMQDVVTDLCRRYEIDGLHLDYIRYNHLLYGWDAADQARYAAAGADLGHLRQLMERTFLLENGREEQCVFDALRAGNPSVQALARVRRQDVTSFAHALVSAARAENSRLVLSAALMPEGAYEDTAFADLHYGQSYQDAAALYDFAVPMAYSRAYGQDARWVREVARGTLNKGLRTVVGLHAYEGGTGVTLRQDRAALQGVPVDGVCLFREGAFVQAKADSLSLLLWNPLDQPVTAWATGEVRHRLKEPVPPGTEGRIPLPENPEELRLFSGEEECCVCVAPEAV